MSFPHPAQLLLSSRFVPVSYTHLDVYKRQIENGVRIANDTAGILENTVKNTNEVTKIISDISDIAAWNN